MLKFCSFVIIILTFAFIFFAKESNAVLPVKQSPFNMPTQSFISGGTGGYGPTNDFTTTTHAKAAPEKSKTVKLILRMISPAVKLKEWITSLIKTDKFKEIKNISKKIKCAMEGKREGELEQSVFDKILENSKMGSNILKYKAKVKKFRKRKWVVVTLSTVGTLMTGNIVADLGSCIPDFKMWSDNFKYRTHLKLPDFGGSTKLMCSEPGKIDLIQNYFYTPSNIKTNFTEPSDFKGGTRSGTDTSGGSTIREKDSHSLDLKFWQNRSSNELFKNFPQVASIGNNWNYGSFDIANNIRDDSRPGDSGIDGFGISKKVLLKEMRRNKSLRESVKTLARSIRTIKHITSTAALTQRAISKKRNDSKSWLEDETVKTLADQHLLNTMTEVTTLLINFTNANASNKMENTTLFANSENVPVDRKTFFVELFDSDPAFFIEQPHLFAEVPEVFIKHPKFLDKHPVAKKKLATYLKNNPELQSDFASVWLDFPYLYSLYAEIVPIEEKFAPYKSFAKKNNFKKERVN